MIDVDLLLPRRRPKKPSNKDQPTPEQLAHLGEPDRFKYINAVDATIIWQSQAGMQTDLFKLSDHVDEILLGGLRGPGKFQPLDSNVLTPKGWKRMGDIRVGDWISDPTTGGATLVIGVFPQGKKKVYRITFDDGASTEVGMEHLWAYKIPNRFRPRTRPSSERQYAETELGRVPSVDRWDKLHVGTTAELQQKLKIGLRPRIPLTDPVAFTRNTRAHFGLPPYLLGLFLGDGSTASLRITSCDDEIREFLEQQGFRPQKELHTDGKPKEWLAAGRIRKLLDSWLRNHDLRHARSWEKFVPEYVLWTRLQYRVEFLQGLFDSDGTVDKDGHAYFTTTSKALAEGVRLILWSLGAKVKWSEKIPTYSYRGVKKKGRRAYTLYVQTPKTSALFRLSRKRLRCADRWNGGYENMRAVVSIKETGEKECQCIAISSPHGLYLTDDFIVTHNTAALIAWMAQPADKPRYRGLMLRLTGEALKETLDMAWQVYRQLGAVRRNRPVEFHFPSGAIINTGHLKDERSFEDYRGHEYQRIGIEEASQIGNRLLYLMLLGSNRSTVPDLKPKMLLTSNPDGPGNSWLKKRFINVYFKGVGDKVKPKTPFHDPIEKKTRIFIPGRRDENKILLKHNPHYYDQFNSLPEHLRRAWVEGDWDAPASSYFPEFRPHGPLLTKGGMEPPEACHVIPAKALPGWCHRWLAMDWGYAHHLAVYWGSRGPDKRLHVYREFVVRKMGADVAGAELARRSVKDLEQLPNHHMNLYLSHEAFSVRDGDKTIAEQIQTGIETILGPGSAFLLAMSEDEKELKKKDSSAALQALLHRREHFGANVKITVRRCIPDRVSGWSYLRTLLRWKPISMPIRPDAEYAKTLLSEPDGFVKYHAYLDMFKDQLDEVLPGLLIHGPNAALQGIDNAGCPILIETIPKLCCDVPRKPEDVRKFEGDEDNIGDDPADTLRFLVMGYQKIENDMPFPVWMQSEVGKYISEDETDINLRIQAAMRAQQKYDSEHKSFDVIPSLPRAALAARNLGLQ